MLDGVTAPGESALGFTYRFSPISPYEGSERKTDLLPYFLYDSTYFYLQSDRIGLKLENERGRAELFVRRRLEGFASDRVPESMVGQTQRFGGDDLGIAGRYRLGAGVVYGELMTNVSEES
ncbi:MAG TPA: MipA/OmpV family protein, partial [Burkholderiales bacterium]|nr:MipA/OmpV family protein [Burkholderiales bacterium]